MLYEVITLSTQEYIAFINGVSVESGGEPVFSQEDIGLSASKRAKASRRERRRRTGYRITSYNVCYTKLLRSSAARLLGATCVLVGVSAPVARALVALPDKQSLPHCVRDLQSAIAGALRRRAIARRTRD